MKNKLDKIAEEYADVFDGMNWRWETPAFKGVPDKEKIKKDIADKIVRLDKLGYDSYTSSGRITVSKKLFKDEDGTYWEYHVSLNNKFIDEDELDEILESTRNLKGRDIL